MSKQKSKLSPQWIINTRDYFLKFLKVTKFPAPKRNGNKGSEFEYPEWLIMFIAILSVKCKIKTYLGIHRLVTEYWNIIANNYQFKHKIISETQLRDRLKKICHQPRKPAKFIYQIFSPEYLQ
jgi:hypothetical protein